MNAPSGSERRSDGTKRGLFLIDQPLEQQLTSLGSAFHFAPVGLCVLDLGFRYTIVNACFAGMYRLPIEEFAGRRVEEVLPGPALQIIAHLNRVLETNSVYEAEIEVTLPVLHSTAGELEKMIYLRSAQPIRDPAGQVVGISVAVLDITSRKRMEAALRESEDDLRYTVELTPHIPWNADAQGELTFISTRWNKMTGRRPEEIIRVKDWAGTLHPDDRPATASAWKQSVDTGNSYDAMYRVKCGDRSWRWMRARAYPRRNSDGAIVRWYGTIEDINERKLIEAALQSKTEELARRAQEDHLTGLANRRRFDDFLGQEFERARRSRLPLALVLIDVDHFKRFNDTWGHVAGDECLKAVAAAISSATRRPGDLAARFGGEEFAMILPATSKEGANEVALAVMQALQRVEPGPTGLKHHSVTVSAGIAVFYSQGGMHTLPEAMALIEAADVALYRSKAEGRDRITLAPDM